jgi:hypothetical protein
LDGCQIKGQPEAKKEEVWLKKRFEIKQQQNPSLKSGPITVVPCAVVPGRFFANSVFAEFAFGTLLLRAVFPVW